MESLGIMGFIFGLAALGKIILLEKKLKESGLLKEETKLNDKWFLIRIILSLYAAANLWILDSFRLVCGGNSIIIINT